MHKRTWLWGGTLTGVVLAATLGIAHNARSADHLDAPATQKDPSADINDVYSWLDGNNAVLAMTVYPAAGAADAGAPGFSDQVQYVFHTSSGAALGNTPSDKDIIATFDATGKIDLWVGSDEHVTGDPSAKTGLMSADGKVKVFAGLRADPFFFNLAGFNAAVAAVDSAKGGLTFNDAGCPFVPPATAAYLRNTLKSNPADAGADGLGGPAQNFFANLNTLAIVVSVDKTLLNGGGPITAIWGSTNRKP